MDKKAAVGGPTLTLSKGLCAYLFHKDIEKFSVISYDCKSV